MGRLRFFLVACASWFLALVSTNVLAVGSTVDRLPPDFAVVAPQTSTGSRRWSTRDIVQVRDITEVAINETTHEIGFVVKQAFIDSDEVRYGLYVVDPVGHPARKLLEGAFIADLSWHPSSTHWTVRADLGAAVQLYDVDGEGRELPLVLNRDTAPFGGYDGVRVEPLDYTRQIGVISYQWSQDGNRLWYARFRSRPVAERQAILDRGVTFDEGKLSYSFTDPQLQLLGTELHLLNVTGHTDHLLAFVPDSGWADAAGAGQKLDMAYWDPDEQHIQYFLDARRENGERDMALWRVDPATEVVQRVFTASSTQDAWSTIRSPDGNGYITIALKGDTRQLEQLGDTGEVVRDYGSTNGARIIRGLGRWAGKQGGPILFGVWQTDREGLMTIPRSAGQVLENVPDNLSDCAFSRDLSLGVCVRQNVTLPPELVSVSLKNGVGKVLVRPNATYDELTQLRFEPVVWTNKYGSTSNGYVTYPRDYDARRKYPVLVVTHGHDAKNKFAYNGFQWDYPIQVFADQGYLVLSVNEPEVTSKTQDALNAWANMSKNIDVSRMQFLLGYDAVGSMEAAVQWAVERGLADPAKAGIAGYSRGSHVVKFAMTQSKTFKAGSAGDAAWFSASGYFDGDASTRNFYTAIFGGSPYDEKALENYRKLSPSFRAREFSGPLLQQFAASSVFTALEMNALLTEAHIPTELVYYIHESHLFHEPRHRAAAMELNLDWFDYWLNGREYSDPAKAEQYQRWHESRELYERASKP
jgi:dipeptidyl aminopeptidase/acylaminoacyl peptidase